MSRKALTGIELQRTSLVLDKIEDRVEYVVVRHVGSRHMDEPLTETVFLILSSISAEPRHGYAIMQDVEAMTNGRVRLSTGTLYGALRRLLDAGLIRRF